MFQSIRGRLILSYVFLVLCTVATMSILGMSLVQRYAIRQEREFLNANAQAIARQAALFMHLPGREAGLYHLTQSAAFLGDIDVRIYDPTDHLLAGSSPGTEATEFAYIADPVSDPYTDPRTDILSGTVSSPFDSGTAAMLIFRLPPHPQENEADASPVAADAGNIITVRRSPSFWGHRLSFGAAHDLEIPMAHHMHDIDMHDIESAPITMAERMITPTQSNTTTRSAFATSSAAPREGKHAIHPVPSRLAAIRERIYPMQAQIAIAPIGAEMGAETGNPVDNIPGQYGYVTVSRATDFRDEPLTALRRVFFIAAAGAIGLATVIGLGVSQGLTAPIQNLAQAAGRMQAGDLSARAPVHSQDELGQLASQFNRMAQQLQNSFDELQQERDTLRRFVADASHELRTPMTALRTFTELLQGNAGADAAARAEFLRESAAQLTRLEWITHNLLDLSRLDAGVATLDMARHELASLLEAAASPFRAAAQTAGVELVTHWPLSPVPIVCDGARIEMAVRNLIDNALKFTSPGGKVEIGVEPMADTQPKERTTSTADDKMDDTMDDITGGVDKQGYAVRIWVQDTGTGIDPTDRPHIFERFYRSPQARREGSGLGLAIVRSVAQAHGGEVTVQSTPGLGSRFELILPSLPPGQDAPPA